jgi:hypothetical protein
MSKKVGWTEKPIKDNPANHKHMEVSPKGEKIASKKISTRFGKITKHLTGK